MARRKHDVRLLPAEGDARESGIERIAARGDVRVSPFFVGRERELEQLTEHLVFGTTRLLTLIGCPGSGKSMLAAEFAVRGGSAFRSVLHFELSRARSIEDWVHIALRRDTDEPPGFGSFIAQIAQEGPCLVILDNFDALLPRAATALSELVRGAVGARFLVTSGYRTLLHHEHVIEVGPLDLPSTPVTAARVSDSAAVELFVRRTRAVRPDYQMDDEEAQRVSAIVARLDGVPLAVELAAFRMAALDSSALLARLQHPLDVLTRPGEDSSVRHSSVRAALQTAWSRLEQAEQEALAQCSVFRGAFDLEAALAVIALPGFDVVEVIQRLVEKSLVRVESRRGMPLRYRLLEIVVEFAAEQLELRMSGAFAMRRCARYYLDRSEHLRPDERGNLRAIVERARPLDLVSIADAIDAMLASRHKGSGGATAKAMRELDPDSSPSFALELCEEGRAEFRSLPPAIDVALLATVGYLQLELGDCEGAEAAFDDALKLAREKSDKLSEGSLLGGRGLVAWQRGAPAEARAIFERAKRLLSSINCVLELVRIHLYAGMLAVEEGRLEVARAAIALASSVPEHPEIAVLLKLGRGCLLLSTSSGDAINALIATDAGCRWSPRDRLLWRHLESRLSNEDRWRLRLELEDPESRSLLVGDDGSWFRLPGQGPVDLRHRPKLAALLRVLARMRAQGNTEPIALPFILEAVWPGEKILPAAGLNRIYATVASLRRLGMGALLEQRANGYRLTTSTPIRIIRA